MARYSEEAKIEHREIIRALVTRNSNLSYRRIAEITNLDKDYVGVHVKKIKKERFKRFDNKILQEELAFLEDIYTNLCAKAFDILESGSPRVKLEAIRTIASLQLFMFRTKVESGVLIKQTSSKKGEMVFTSRKELTEFIYNLPRSSTLEEEQKTDKIDGSNISAG